MSERAEGLYWVRWEGAPLAGQPAGSDGGYPIAHWDGERWWPLTDEGWLREECYSVIGPAVPPSPGEKPPYEQGLEDAAQLAEEMADNTTGAVQWAARRIAKEIREKLSGAPSPQEKGKPCTT